MESIAARAFKSSCFFSEIAVKSASPLAGEEFSSVSAASAGGGGEDFSVVDEYFDLHGLLEEEGEENNCSSSLSLNSLDHVDDGSSGAGLSDLFSGADGLAVPVDDMKELELWSKLMDDTVTDDICAVKTGPNAANRVQLEPQPKPATVEAICPHPPVQTKPRSKRVRTATGSSVFGRKMKKRRRAGPESGGSAAGPVQQRRCMHCLVQKTPQWRTGPLGPKTLCNACGVRFKSGRLFPEYRPACSPTFLDAVHSNSHRKVLEMREKKMAELTEPGAVQQF